MQVISCIPHNINGVIATLTFLLLMWKLRLTSKSLLQKSQQGKGYQDLNSGSLIPGSTALAIIAHSLPLTKEVEPCQDS